MATITTKEQERKALEKIRKIVAELGENSYIGMALEGCLDDAERNIEEDAAYSMKNRWQIAEGKVSAKEAKIATLEGQLDDSKKELAHAQAKADDLARRLLSSDDLADCKQMTENLISELRDGVKAAEATILEYAEHPETTTFCDAVRDRKNLTADIDYYEKLRERLVALLG